MATHRVRCGKMQKGCLCMGAPKEPGEGPQLTVVSQASPSQEVEGSGMEARRQHLRRRGRLGTSRNRWELSFFLSLLLHLGSKPIGCCHSHLGRGFSPADPFSHTQNYTDPM